MQWIVLVAALVVPPEAQDTVNAAITDVARRFAVKARVVQVERATWPDSSLGCPQEGMMYTQRTVPGWRIVLAVGSRSFEYHAGEAGALVHCAPGKATKPVGDSKG